MKYVLNVKRCLRHLYALNTKSDQNSNTTFNTYISKICHTHPTFMKLGTVIPYLNQMRKRHHVTHPLSFDDSAFFHWKSEKRNIKEYRYRLYFGTEFLILLAFFESLKIVLMNMVKILVISAKYHQNIKNAPSKVGVIPGFLWILIRLKVTSFVKILLKFLKDFPSQYLLFSAIFINFLNFLTFPCYKETNDVSLYSWCQHFFTFNILQIDYQTILRS